VDIPLVKISHANGGTSEILPSAITDAPNPAVQDFPAYHDVRVKSVRILGLQDGDTVEYRVVTTTTNHPLAPDFWLEHTFDRSGQVLEENYELDYRLLEKSSSESTLKHPRTPLRNWGRETRLALFTSGFGTTGNKPISHCHLVKPISCSQPVNRGLNCRID